MLSLESVYYRREPQVDEKCFLVKVCSGNICKIKMLNVPILINYRNELVRFDNLLSVFT